MEKSGPSSAFKIDNWYNDILKDYQIRLQKEEKVGRIPPNKSEDIIKRIREILRDNTYLLKASYRALLKQEQMQIEEKLKQEEKNLENAVKDENFDIKKLEDVIEDEFEFMEKEEVDHNDKTTKAIVDDVIVKKEENESEQLIQDDQDNNREYQDTKRLRKYVLDNLDACFEGMFISSRKKYIAKSQRTRFELENVFIKMKDREAIYKTITCDLNTVKAEDVKPGYFM